LQDAVRLLHRRAAVGEDARPSTALLCVSAVANLSVGAVPGSMTVTLANSEAE
jgi:hypothetical protein